MLPACRHSSEGKFGLRARCNRRTYSPSKRLTNCTEGRTQACNQSNVLIGLRRVSSSDCHNLRCWKTAEGLKKCWRGLNWLKSSSCSGPKAILLLPIVLVTPYSFTDVLEQES